MAAVQDLPDPLEKPSATPPSQSPDDLLSQMADDAIDKLIAEADAQSAATATPASPSRTAQGHAPSPASSPAAAPPPAAINLIDDDALIDSLLAEPMDDEPPAATLASVLTTADASPAPAAESGNAPSHAATANPVPHEISSSADIKALLADSGPSAHKKNSDSPLLAPLRLLSAPLTHADDSIRNAIGQIAIATLLNAIAVLIYVLIVRHK